MLLMKQCKITPVDLRAQELWDEYTKYKKKMFHETNTSLAPWHIIDANKKMPARIKAIKIILERLPYNKGQ